MKKQLMAGMAAGLLLIGMSGTAQASLVVAGTVDSGPYQGVQVINDTDLNITWLDYTNSRQTWSNQVDWASNLSLMVNGITYSDWRLPNTVDAVSSADYNITSSEMGHLYYAELGLQNYLDRGTVVTAAELNTKGFQNLVESAYWSGTDYYKFIYYDAWFFHMATGRQGVADKSSPIYGLAVRSGQISAVPAPATLLLMGSGLAGLLGVRRKKK